MADSNSFDRLVSGLSSGERKDMLEKMKASTSINESLSSDLIEDDPDDSISFSQQIKEESIFYRIYLWIKALLASTTMEAIYNERKISQIAKRIDKISPGLMDYKRGLLLSSFYDKLMELKKCADFFRPYITVAENDDSAYLVFLGSLVMNDVERQRDEEVDPYSIPLTDGPKPEQRMSLLRKMDEVITQIPQGQRNMMYGAVRAAEWLKTVYKTSFPETFICIFYSYRKQLFCRFQPD